MRLVDGQVYFGTAGVAPNIVDLHTGMKRKANTKDVADITRLGMLSKISRSKGSLQVLRVFR